ncbi:MAG: META domain-containing protein [Beijerinckiaceae bacterium]|nr:META domain-containing protein [Beijerinckiaceae bacterium]MCZ8300795.1 META domain-containing protein [Beijerinckiaceae bacterium]
MNNHIASLILTSMVSFPPVMVRLASAEPFPDLTANGWLVAGLSGKPPAGATPPTLRFDAAGRVSGSTGCNRFSARFVLDGPLLAISAAATTRMACPKPLMMQEAAFLRALGEVTTFRAGASGTLILAGEAGELFRLVPLR